MSSFRRAVSIGVFVVCASGLSAGPQWLKAQIGSVTVLSDLSRSDVADLTVRFAAYRHALETLLAPPGQKMPPSILIIFRNASKLEELLLRADRDHKLISQMALVDGTTEMAMTYEQGRDGTLSFAIEFDAINTINRLGYFLPVWMTQGTGEVFAAMEMKKDRCIIGTDNDRVLEVWNREPGLPWRRFFELTADSPEYSGKDAHGVYQAQAWALMHTILLDRGTPHDRFAEAARLVQENPRGGVAAEAILGVALDKFPAMVDQHMSRSHTVEVPFDSGAAAAQLQIVPAPEAEVRVRTADILLGAGRRSLVDAELARASELAPDSAMVDEAIARNRAASGDSYEQIEHYRKAIAEGSQDEMAYLYSAQARLDESKDGRFDREGDGGTNIPPAIDEIHQALKLDSTSRLAWQMLARAYFLKNHLAESDPDDLRPALTNDAAGLELRLRRAEMYHRLGHFDLAFAELKVISASPACTETMAQRVRLNHDFLQFDADTNAARSLAPQGKYAELLARLTQGRASQLTQKYAESYDGMIANITEAQAAAQLFALYKAAQYPEFLTQVDPFLARYPKDSNGANLRRMRDRATNQTPSEALPPDPPTGDSAVKTPGIFADDERFAPYSSYLDAMYARIKEHWEQRVRALPHPLPAGTVIEIRVTLNERGEIVSMLRLDDEPAEAAAPCFAAIRDRFNYGAWTPEMSAALGARTTVIVRFVYE